jgi:hypothetical protein
MTTRWLWLLVVLIEAALLVVFCWWALSADYFVRMPESVRHGSTVSAVVTRHATWLAVVFGMFNVSVAAWRRGVRCFEESKRAPAFLLFFGGVASFLIGCWLLVLFVIFGFAQY